MYFAFREANLSEHRHAYVMTPWLGSMMRNIEPEGGPLEYCRSLKCSLLIKVASIKR